MRKSGVSHEALGFVQNILPNYTRLEDTARYASLLLAPAEGFGLRPRLFLPVGQKKNLLCCFGPFLAIVGVQYFYIFLQIFSNDTR